MLIASSVVLLGQTNFRTHAHLCHVKYVQVVLERRRKKNLKRENGRGKTVNRNVFFSIVVVRPVLTEAVLSGLQFL